MPTGTHRNGHPVSVKGVLLVEGRVLLLRNDRDEWELPGGRPEIGETWPEALVREIREEADLAVDVGALLEEWPYEVLPGRFVWVAAYGCRLVGAPAPSVSAEHRELRFFRAAELDGLILDAGYRRVISRSSTSPHGPDRPPA